MDHWFDRLTKALAQGKLSRREMMGSAIKASLAAIGAPILSRSNAFAHLLTGDLVAQPRANACTSRREGRTRTFSLSASSTFNGKSLTYTQTTKKLSRKGNTALSETIKLGGETLLEIDATEGATSTRVTVKYGSGFQGIKRATFTTTDGRVLQGEVDGHRLQSYPIGSDPKSVKAVDGKASPSVLVSAETSNAIRAITDKAKQVASSCSAGRANLDSPTRRLANAAEDAGQDLGDADERPFSLTAGSLHSTASTPAAALVAQGDSGHDSYPEQSSGCLACEGACTAAGIACGAAAAAACVASFGFGCAAAIAGCVITEVACFEGCHATGAFCCPVSCGDVACCEKTETCLDPNRGVCCSKGLSNCSNKHCCQPTDTCIKATGFCCPAGLTVCNNVCCKKGEACKNGVVCCPPEQETCGKLCCGPNEKCVNNKTCCPKISVCGDACCDKLSKCVDASASLCCSFAAPTCGGTCCKPGQQCINGKCCSRPCGEVCCSSGQQCQDPKTGKCVTKICASGQVTCVSQESASKLGAALCCPPNVQCCLGKCCKKGELCCSGGGTPFGCHDPQLCVA